MKSEFYKKAFGFVIALSGFSFMSVTSVSPSPRLPVAASGFEYLWFEAENMRGLTENGQHEPQLNPSYLELPAVKVPGWSISGPGVSAEWSQGGESEWNSVAASADETRGTLWQNIEVPRGGEQRVWVRYADWAGKTENFVVRIVQQDREVFRHEFGARDVIDPHDETSMYWSWSFAWDSATTTLAKGQARVLIEIEKPAEARRQVDCFLITTDLTYVPSGRSKPDFPAMRYLREWSRARPSLTPLIGPAPSPNVPTLWQRPQISGRDFVVPWNITKEFWTLYDKPAGERPLYPFNAEPVDEFVKAFAGKRDVPIFASKLIVPVVYINDLAILLKDGSAFRRYLAETKSPFAILINYGAVNLSDAEGQAAWKLLHGELREQFLGWLSGESIGYVWEESPRFLKLSPEMTRAQMLDALHKFYSDALKRKWSAIFKTETGSDWNKLIPAQSTSSTSYAHALSEWGVRVLGMETAAVQPMTAMRIAFTRGAARQYGGEFFYYHAPNFGDTATTFTRQQNFAGPDNFFHSRYGATMGPSLSWYRKSYYLYYMSGASAIYLEQGFDQFFKPGPGEHPFQLNPLGRITNEFLEFAEKHPDRGTPYTPIAFLLDPAHGWDMTDYPQWPFGVSQINRGDRALRELFGAAYCPGLVRESEPASGERQAFVPGVFGNIFDMLVATDFARIPPVRKGVTSIMKPNDPFPPAKEEPPAAYNRPLDAIDAYRAVILGGRIEGPLNWTSKVEEYVRNGGVLVLNSAQAKPLSHITGVWLTGTNGEAQRAVCSAPNEPTQDLSGQIFRYDRLETRGASVFMTTPTGDPLVTINKIGKGKVVMVAIPDYLGEDERLVPLMAHLLAHLAAEATPVHVEGDVEYSINRNSRGWVATIFNDNGVFKPQQGLAQVDRNAIVSVKISLRGEEIKNAVNWIDEKPLAVSNNQVNVTLAAGGIAVVELVTR